VTKSDAINGHLHRKIEPIPVITMSSESHIFPIYLALDVSGSMAGMVIEELNQGLSNIFSAIVAEPSVVEKVRICVISFAQETKVEMPLSDLREVTVVPRLSAGGPTVYSHLFDSLKVLIEHDVATLKAAGFLVHRPAVFFFTDGAPTDTDWSKSLEAIQSQSFPLRPNIIAFGIGAADPGVLQQVSSRPGFAFLSALGTGPDKALPQFINSLTSSVIQSGRTIGDPDGAQLIVAIPSEFVTIPDSP